MMVFLSWSGEISRQVATVLREWIPSVIQAVTPWMSAHDIDSGKRWGSELANKLEEISIGVACLTNENLSSPWLHFEAGALSKLLDESALIPLLFNIKPTDMTDPFAQFQYRNANKDGIRMMMESINNTLGDHRLGESTFSKVFERGWPELEEEFNRIKSASSSGIEDPVRTEKELIEEVLAAVRSIRREIRSQFQSRNELTIIEDEMWRERNYELTQVRLVKALLNINKELRLVEELHSKGNISEKNYQDEKHRLETRAKYIREQIDSEKALSIPPPPVFNTNQDQDWILDGSDEKK